MARSAPPSRLLATPWPDPGNRSAVPVVPGGGASLSVTIGAVDDPTQAGLFSLAVPPGRYRLEGHPDSAERFCDPVEVTVTEGKITEVNVSCSAP